MNEIEILASGGGWRARNTRLTRELPINLRDIFKQKCVWEFLEGLNFLIVM